MPRYQQRPCFVEAEQFVVGTPMDGVEYLYEWQGQNGLAVQNAPVVYTATGTVRVFPGDWIVTRTTTDRYVVSAAIFAALYELAVESEL